MIERLSEAIGCSSSKPAATAGNLEMPFVGASQSNQP